MVFSKEFDNKIRFLVLYQDVTKTPTRIQKYLNIPLSTIYDWIKRIKQNEDIFVVKEGRGPKHKVQNETKDQIIESATKQPFKASARILGAEDGVSKSTAYRVLKDEGFKFSSTQKEYHVFTEEEKENRVQYCQSMLKRKGEPIDESFFADEMGININNTHKKHVWIPQGNKKVKSEKPDETVKLNFWGAISRSGATSLYVYKQNLNSELYEEIIEEHQEQMEEISPKDIQLVHENSKVHVAAEPQIEGLGIKLISFPTYSPDLNPIENVWVH